MAKAYSQDLRDRILAAYDRGKPTRQVAEAFQVSPAWARRVKQRRRQSGSICAKPMGGLRVVKIDLERLRQLVAQQPDATIKELHQRLACDCSQSAVGMALARLNLTFKKRRSMRRSRIAPTLPSAAPVGNTGRPASRRSG
jgi:transposase